MIWTSLVASVLAITAEGLITWPISTKVGQQAEAMAALTGNRHVYATCDYIVFPDHVTHTEAEARCRDVSLGMTTSEGWGRLATVNDEQKNQELSDLMKVAFGPSVGPELGGKYNDTNWLWVGLRKVRNLMAESGLTQKQKLKKALKLKGTFKLEDWEWEDGSPADPSWMNWDKTQPDQKPDETGIEQNVVRMYKKGAWDDTYFYQENPYACDYKGRYIIVETTMTVSAAKEACEAAGLTLAKVRNAAENDELVQAINLFLPKQNGEKWAQSNWVWIGLYDVHEEGNFVWFDGEELGWKAPWARGQPDNARKHFGKSTTQNHVAVNRKGRWDDSYGEDRERPFACMCA